MKKLILSFVVVVVLGLLWWNQSKNSAVPATGEPIKIGGIFILSGEGASWGEAAKNGMELAIKEINAEGGIEGKPLQGIYEDDGSDPSKAISAFNKLTNSDGVKFIIGPNWSNTGLSLIELIKQHGVVAISPSLGLPAYNESSEYIFNTWPHDEILSENLAQYVYDKGYRNVAVFGANDVWVKAQDQAFIKKFVELGGKIAFLYEPLVTETDVMSEVTKVKNDKSIDAIVLTVADYGLSSIVPNRLKELGVSLPISSLTVSFHVINNCGNACEGMTFLTFLTPTSDFEKKYKAAYDNREVEIGADSAYDAVMLLADAFKKTGSVDPGDVQAYLNKIEKYEGASGSLVADGEGAFTKPYLIKKVQNGLPVTIKE